MLGLQTDIQHLAARYAGWQRQRHQAILDRWILSRTDEIGDLIGRYASSLHAMVCCRAP